MKVKLLLTVAALMVSFVPPAQADVTGDGRADVLARDATGRLWLFDNTGEAQPWSWLDRGIVGADMNYVDTMMFGDVNLDGLDDLVVREPGLENGTLWVIQRDRGTTSWTTRLWCGTGWNIATALDVADVNGDGRDDMVLRDSAGRLWLYPHSGGASPFPARTQIGANWQSATLLRLADVTGDGRPDIVARDRDGFLWIYPYSSGLAATSAWTFGSRAATSYPAGAGWERYDSLRFTDVDGDGRTDAVGRDAAGTLWVYYNNNAPQGENPWPTRTAAGDWWAQYTYLLA